MLNGGIKMLSFSLDYFPEVFLPLFFSLFFLFLCVRVKCTLDIFKNHY